ncbi:hypothetical protein L218DRAFT_331893 [Marasmius fiardii PR-910]|nr:hypothetical protein L218DRAFT_331893 [Marasmius fiardii PR-910]
MFEFTCRVPVLRNSHAPVSELIQKLPCAGIWKIGQLTNPWGFQATAPEIFSHFALSDVLKLTTHDSKPVKMVRRAPYVSRPFLEGITKEPTVLYNATGYFFFLHPRNTIQTFRDHDRRFTLLREEPFLEESTSPTIDVKSDFSSFFFEISVEPLLWSTATCMDFRKSLVPLI